MLGQQRHRDNIHRSTIKRANGREAMLYTQDLNQTKALVRLPGEQTPAEAQAGESASDTLLRGWHIRPVYHVELKAWLEGSCNMQKVDTSTSAHVAGRERQAMANGCLLLHACTCEFQRMGAAGLNHVVYHKMFNILQPSTRCVTAEIAGTQQC